MVRPKSTDNIHEATVELTENEKLLIEGIIDNSPVELREAKISNPTNDLQGLYIQIYSENRSDLYADETKKALRKCAEEAGYNSSKMETGNFPTDVGDGLTLAVWFKHRT